MAKSVHDDVLDGALNIVKNNCNIMVACNQAPATRTEAVTTYALADIAMTSGDFTAANGDVSGRKLTVAAKTGATIDTGGIARAFALCDGSRLLYVTESPKRQITNGGAASNKGDGTVGIPCVGHGFVAGMNVDITGTLNYNGAFTLHANTSTDELVITTSFSAETFGSDDYAQGSQILVQGNQCNFPAWDIEISDPT